MALVTMLTDFGLADAYVGQMKGALLHRCPQAVIIDLTHQLPPQDVTMAAVVLAASYGHFPPGTIHLAVVDPGVGTDRRALAAKINGHYFVLPDNGLLTMVLQGLPPGEKARIRMVGDTGLLPKAISPTFHGRDIFAPIAGHLACGLGLDRVGPAVDDPVRLDLPRPMKSSRNIVGQVLYVDHFGNLITNIAARDVLNPHRPGSPQIKLGGQTLNGLHLTYAEVPSGRPLALIGSADLLEISVNQGRADRFFELERGAPVEVRW